jgi:hypothetical protein
MLAVPAGRCERHSPMNDKIALLSALPIRTRPLYSFSVCLDRIGSVVHRAQSNISPSFLRKMMGGVDKDHARSVVATCSADLHAIVRVAYQIQAVAKDQANSSDANRRHKGAALTGYCERLITATTEWRNHATDFESNIFGSDKEMVEQCARVIKIHDIITRSSASLED